MTRTSKALKRLGVAGIAVATIGAGVPAFFATSAIAATVTPTQITANDCPAASPTTTTAPSGVCTTQAQVGTVRTLSFTESDANGNGAPGRTIDFTVSSPSNQAIFPASQPAGTSTTTPKAAQCTTDANGVCSVNVTDPIAENATVTANDRQSQAAFGDTSGTPCTALQTAAGCVNGTTEQVVFRTQATDPTSLREMGRVTVAPEASSTSLAPTPGRPEQVTYQVNDANNKGLAGQTVTLAVDQSAFFTPNCTPKDANGVPTRTGTGALNAPTYTSCTFDPAPTAGAQAGSLKNSGKRITVTTDQNGQFTVTVAESRDIAFDSTGVVPVTITATASGGSAAFDQTGPNANSFAPAIYFTTRTDGRSVSNPNGPLNGASVNIIQVGKTPTGQQTLSDSGTVNIPDTQSRDFAVALRDQFGNLTETNSTDSTSATTRGAAYVTKSGVGEFRCVSGRCNSVQTSPSTTGSNTQLVAVHGTYNNDPEIFRTDAQNPSNNSVAPEDGVQSLTATYNAERSTYTFSTGTKPALTGVDQTKYQTLTDVVTINYYTQNPTDITFKTTPSNTVPAGTAVTVTATVKDQFGNAVAGQPVTFLRSGTSNNCTGTSSNGTGNGQNFGQNTSPSGQAGFTFSCADPSTQNVTVVVSDNNGNELARNTQVITFTGTAPSQSPSASPSATSTVTASPSATGSPSNAVGGRGVLDATTPDIQPNEQGVLQASNLTGGATYELRCYSRPSTSYFTARTASVATGNSTLEFRILPGTNTRCYVRPAGNDAAASNTVVINVHTTLSLSTVFRGGRTYTFQGRNLPRRSGQLITLYRVANGKEIRAANLTTDASGIYRLNRTFTGSGTFDFLVRTSQTLTNAPGKSNVITVTIR